MKCHVLGVSTLGTFLPRLVSAPDSFSIDIYTICPIKVPQTFILCDIQIIVLYVERTTPENK